QQLDATRQNQLTLTTENLNGIPTPAKVDLSIAPLTFPGKLYRERMWETPDRYAMTEQEFRRLFPDDEYADESNYMNWPVGQTSWSATVYTGERQLVELPATVWQSTGWHVVTLTTTDPQGNEITEKIYTYAAKHTTDATPQQPLLVLADKTTAEPGDALNLTVKTGFDSTYVLETSTDIKPEFTTFSEHRKISRPIVEADRGGVGFGWLYVHNNRVYQGTHHVDIPWSNRDLQLEWATHRDKLLPGASEEWRLTIKGSKKETVAAELLAGLYDASLDALKPHAWHWNALSPTRWLGLYWTTDRTFGTNAGTLWLNNLNGQPPAGYEKRYDELLNYPARYHQTYYADSGIQIRGANRLASASVPAMEADASVVEEVAVVGYGQQKEMAQNSTAHPGPPTTPNEIIPVRANLQETAFFFPQLQTDA